MVEFNKEELLNNFSQATHNNEYKPLPYKEWRALKATPGNVIIVRPHVTDSNKICIHWRDTLTTCQAYINAYDINDGSFGSYLNHCVVYGTQNNEATKAKDVTYNSSDTRWGITNGNVLDHVTASNSDYTISSSDNPYWSNTDNLIIMKTPCDEEDVRRIEDIINNCKDKENKKMDTSNLFNFDFGPVSSNQFRMSPYGLAVRTQTNGWVAYNAKTGDLMDVDILNFDISKMIYKMPVALTAIKPGDILMHSGKPVFVREVATNGNTVRVIDYANATVADILPVKSPFGFNFFTKVWPLFNFDQTSADSDNPFGNMLPFLMLSGEKDDSFDPTLLFMASAMNGGNMDFASNPMMLYCLMNCQNKGDILPFLMMMNGGQMFSNPPTSATATT